MLRYLRRLFNEDLIRAYDGRILDLKDRINQLEEEKNELRDKLYLVLRVREAPPQVQQNVPIPKNWAEMKAALEQKHKKKAAPEVEEYWRNKIKEAEDAGSEIPDPVGAENT